MTIALQAYFEALDRLKKNQPDRVSIGTKITNDAVALEAGRGKGSIKKSRVIFSDLIEAIDAAAADQSKPKDDAREKLGRAKDNAEKYRVLYEQALARELSLLHENHELKQRIAALSSKVTRIK